jgi:VIT1/CCC1 family predicted Fe2+/Mn2+ transporter
MPLDTQTQPLERCAGWLKRYIADIVYGANDGIITTFTIVSGVQGAKLTSLIVIILGFVNLLADGLSMGASSYLSLRVGNAAKGLSCGYLEPFLHGLATFLAFMVLGSIPLISYLIPGFAEHQFWISCTMTAIALFSVGSLRVFVVGKGWLQGGLEMLTIGGIVSIIAYLAGHVAAEVLMK